MSLTTLLQMGVVKRLPDPPVGNFNTKKVNSSGEAYSYGGPDSPIAILAHSVNLVLASTGGPDRARKWQISRKTANRQRLECRENREILQ